MPLGAKDRGLLADALGNVTGLSPANRKHIKEALKSLPSLSALTGGIARAKEMIRRENARKRPALPWTRAQLAVQNAITHKARSTDRVRQAASARGAMVVKPIRRVQAMEEPDCPGDADLSRITGDSQPAANRSRKWFPYASVFGWESAQEILVQLSDAQVQGGAWRAGKMAENKNHVVYHFRCPFRCTHGCPWEVRVRIRKHQLGQNEKQGEKESVLVRMCKTSEERKREHALHVCDVELDEKFPHADHTEIQTNGPHQFWVCAAEGNPMMYGWDKAAISQWLEAKKVKFGSGQDKHCALERIVRHNRIKRGKQKEREWGGICQHNRIRSRCKTCKADKDESMPPGLEEL